MPTLLAVLPPSPGPPSGARWTPRSGFTLFEVLVVLVLMMILAGLGTTGLVSSVEHAKVRRAASMLSADLQYAQGMAARQRRPVVFILNPDLRFYIVRDRASTVVYRQRFLGTDTDFEVETLTAAPASTVDLFPNGAARTTTTFTIGLKSYERKVTLTRAGQIRLLPASP